MSDLFNLFESHKGTTSSIAPGQYLFVASVDKGLSLKLLGYDECLRPSPSASDGALQDHFTKLYFKGASDFVGTVSKAGLGFTVTIGSLIYTFMFNASKQLVNYTISNQTGVKYFFDVNNLVWTKANMMESQGDLSGALQNIHSAYKSMDQAGQKQFIENWQHALDRPESMQSMIAQFQNRIGNIGNSGGLDLGKVMQGLSSVDDVNDLLKHKDKVADVVKQFVGDADSAAINNIIEAVSNKVSTMGITDLISLWRDKSKRDELINEVLQAAQKGEKIQQAEVNVAPQNATAVNAAKQPNEVSNSEATNAEAMNNAASSINTAQQTNTPSSTNAAQQTNTPQNAKQMLQAQGEEIHQETKQVEEQVEQQVEKDATVQANSQPASTEAVKEQLQQSTSDATRDPHKAWPSLSSETKSTDSVPPSS